MSEAHVWIAWLLIENMLSLSERTVDVPNVLSPGM